MRRPRDRAAHEADAIVGGREGGIVRTGDDTDHLALALQASHRVREARARGDDLVRRESRDGRRPVRGDHDAHAGVARRREQRLGLGVEGCLGSHDGEHAVAAAEREQPVPGRRRRGAVERPEGPAVRLAALRQATRIEQRGDALAQRALGCAVRRDEAAGDDVGDDEELERYDHAGHAIEASQRLTVERDDAAAREGEGEVGGERFAAEASGLRQPAQQRCRRLGETSHGREPESERGARADQRRVRIALDGARGQRDGARQRRVGGDRTARRVAAELRFALHPGLAAGEALREDEAVVGRVHDGAERALRRALSDRVLHGEEKARRVAPDVLLDHGAQPGRVEQRQDRERVDLQGQRRQAHEPPERRQADADHVAAELDHAADERLEVARMLGAVGRKRQHVEPEVPLHPLDHLGDPTDVADGVVELDDRASELGVHGHVAGSLEKGHAVGEPGGEGLPLGAAEGAQLEVRPAAGDVQAPPVLAREVEEGPDPIDDAHGVLQEDQSPCQSHRVAHIGAARTSADPDPSPLSPPGSAAAARPRCAARPLARRMLPLEDRKGGSAMSTNGRTDAAAAVGRLRREGERLVGRLQRDVNTFARRAKSEIVSDLKTLQKDLKGSTTSAIRDIEGRGKRALASVDGYLAGLEARVLRQLHAASRDELRALRERVEALERRNAELELRLNDRVSTD